MAIQLSSRDNISFGSHKCRAVDVLFRRIGGGHELSMFIERSALQSGSLSGCGRLFCIQIRFCHLTRPARKRISLFPREEAFFGGQIPSFRTGVI